MNHSFQKVILKNLLFNEEYLRIVFPFLKSEYFRSPYLEMFKIVSAFFSKFNERPSLDVIELGMEKFNLSEIDLKEYKTFFSELKSEEFSFNGKGLDWLIEETEKFCRDAAIENAIRKSVRVITGEDKQTSRDYLPELLREAVSVKFDRSVGHDFFEDYKKRYEYYTKAVEKIPFDIDYLNKITNGGITSKTLNIFVGGVNVGKTLTLCHFSTHYLKLLKNVLYITMEMSEEEITKRIEANLLDISIDHLKNMNFSSYETLIKRARSQISHGNLIVKEFPTGMANITHFRKLLLELETKKNFSPDIVIVDYVNICSSARIPNDGRVNTYVLVKAICEELRGFAMENKVPVVTATQLNRSGFSSSDVSMTDVADSFGTAMTADLMISLINNEKLEKSNTIIMKQLKNRYGDATMNKKCYVGINRQKMRLYNVEQEEIDKSLLETEMEEDFSNIDKLSKLFT